MKKTLTSFLLLLFAGLFFACEQEERIYLEQNEEVQLFEHTKVLEREDFNALVLQVDSSDYSLSVSAELIELYDLSPGDVLVSDVGHGMLRRVESISESEDEGVVIATSQATLEDALEKGYVYHRQSLTRGMIEKIHYHQPGIKLDTVSVSAKSKSDDKIVLTIDTTLYRVMDIKGEFIYSSDIIFELDIRRFMRLQKVQFGFESEARAKMDLALAVSANFSRSARMATMYFTPITIPAGPIIIVVVPVLTINLNGDGEAQAVLATGYTQTLRFETGVLYERDTREWSTYQVRTITPTFTAPTVTAGVRAKAELVADISMLVYGVLGAYADAGVYAEFEANPFVSPWWTLDGGYRIGVGARATILGFGLFDVSYPEILGNRYRIAQADTPPGQSGQIVGLVKDAVSDNSLVDVIIDVYQNQQLQNSFRTDQAGGFDIALPGGIYDLLFRKAGYLNVSYHNLEVVDNEQKHLAPIMQIDENFSGFGVISGRITDALTGRGIEGASLQLREGLNVHSGPVFLSDQSQSNGHYVLNNVPAGNYTLTASHSGYHPGSVEVLSIGGETRDNQNISLSPSMGDDEIRIVLDWGATPADLDAHLTGPIPDTQDRFHVYYSERVFVHNYQTYVMLDYDTQHGFGPETITILTQSPGVYRYSVHDYTNRFATGSRALSNSSARVRVFKGSNLLRTFQVPANTPGNLWTVFELNGEQITPVNQLSDQANPGNIQKNTDFQLIQNLPDKP